jgi:hypothetical protein
MTSTLQIIFIVLGVLIVVFVWGYNFLQERKLHRAHLKRFHENSLESDGAVSTLEERKIEPKLSSHEPKKKDKEEEEKPDPWFEAIWRIEFPKPLLVSELPLQHFDGPPQMSLFLEEESGKTISWLAAQDKENANFKIKALLGALPLIKEGQPVSSEILQNFLGLGRKIGEMTAADFGHEEIDSWLAKATKLSSWLHELDIEVILYLKVIDEHGVSATKVRALLEASGFRLEDDGVFRLRDDEGEIRISAYALGTKFSRDNLLTQIIPGLALSIAVPLVKDPLGTYTHLLKLVERWRDPLGIEIVKESGEKLTPAEFEMVRLDIERIVALMRERGIEPGSKRAFRLFNT